jgi:hypothetical protein
MVPLRRSVNPMAPHSPYADLMAQRRPLQTKHTFSTKLEVHFFIGQTRQFLAYISNGPPTGFCESNDTTLALCGHDGPEKTSPDETHIFDQT